VRTVILLVIAVLKMRLAFASEPNVFPGANESTPSRAEYFSWINNTNEGSTEQQTLVNLEFFKWLYDEYGMSLDIYAFDAGNIDGKFFYGSMSSDRFRRQFPNGFEPIAERAKSFGCRLGLWGGPDGFGETPQEEESRIAMMVKLCRDYNFALFKLDAVCGQLRNDKQNAFIEMLKQCRSFAPDLIVLNHRLNLGPAAPYVTTYLWEGAETYIDVHMANQTPAIHNRACALARGLPGDLKRLTEDHGVCLSSCLDFWEDDLVLQAFNRSLILAPQIYGNPWLLRDDEFPKLARIYNLHRRHRDILTSGIVLPKDDYGPNALSRGDSKTRFITLRNLSWENKQCLISLDSSIGLAPTEFVELRQLHPTERVIGLFKFNPGFKVACLVEPFRSCLLMATTRAGNEMGISGCDYQIVRDVPDKPVIIKLLASPGSEMHPTLSSPGRKFSKAALDGSPSPEFLEGKPVCVKFPGEPNKQDLHRKIGDLAACDVPADAEALYEATCFAGNNNALEVRELDRSGPTAIPQVQKARDAFFNQKLFVERCLWDKNLFDGDMDTGFAVCRRWDSDLRINGGSLRVDFGKPGQLDKIVIKSGGEYFLQPLKREEVVYADVSADLKNWDSISFQVENDMTADVPADKHIRYLRVQGCPDRITEVEAYFKGEKLDRSTWRASNLFGPYSKAPAVKAWSLSFTLDEIGKNSYFAIPIYGRFGNEKAYAALRIDGAPVGCPRRAPSFPANTWEVPVRKTDGNYTYFCPVTADMLGKKIDVVVLLLKDGKEDVKPEVWLTAYPAPYEEKALILE
jgi:hypothetical protein